MAIFNSFLYVYQRVKYCEVEHGTPISPPGNEDFQRRTFSMKKGPNVFLVRCPMKIRENKG